VLAEKSTNMVGLPGRGLLIATPSPADTFVPFAGSGGVVGGDPVVL